MSRQYSVTATLMIDGDEQDVQLRAHVMYERQPGGCWGGSIDGDIEAFVEDAWTSLDDLDLNPRDVERAEEALCDECSNDDRSQCVEYAS